MRAGWLAGGEGAPEGRRWKIGGGKERRRGWLKEERERESWLFLVGEKGRRRAVGELLALR